MEEVQWIFHALDQCRRVISTDLLSTIMTERDIDINLVNPFFDVLWGKDLHLHYGEGESRASRYRRGESKTGDRFDWLFACHSILPDDVRGIELGIAQNSGPHQVCDFEKARTDIVKVVKTARDQLKQIIKIIKNRCNSEQLPDVIFDGVKTLFAIGVSVVGYDVRAYVVYLLDGNVFAVSEIGCVRLPKSLDRMHDALNVCHLVLRMKALLLRSRQILEALLTKAVASSSPTPVPSRPESWTIAELPTPKKPRKKPGPKADKVSEEDGTT